MDGPTGNVAVKSAVSAPVRSSLRYGGFLQRKCACGAQSHGSAECAECAKKHETLWRKGDGRRNPSGVPSMVHDVLRTSGQPLDAGTRAFMEPRFGRDFSQVRIHADSAAARSARAVDALAYTVGSHVVFDTHQYAPTTRGGQRLLAHELAHTLQDPGAADMHAALAIGRSDDATEVAADRAADAVMRGERASVSAAGGGLVRRQARECTARTAESPDLRNVHCPDGSDYKVKVIPVDGPRVPGTHASAKPGWNSKQVWLDIYVCRGGQAVTIKPSVDIPQALAAIVTNIVAGSDALKGVAITPKLEFTFVQNKSFTLTLAPSVKVDQGGVAGAGGSVKFENKDVSAEAAATCDPRAKACMFTITIGGGKAAQAVNCTKKGRQHLDFVCDKITHVPAKPEVPAVTTTDTETRYVFFPHASHTVRRDFRMPTDIKALNEAGFRVASIKGFTSPEGPRGLEHAPRFEGNENLSKERAEAAHRWLEEPSVCGGCDLSGIKESGENELPPEQGRQEPEPTGRAMERGAVDEFLGKTGKADPLAPSEPADRAKFERLPFNKQRDRAFELMRRAEIVLQHKRTITERKPGEPARDEPSSVECPSEVIDAARKSFKLNPPGALDFP